MTRFAGAHQPRCSPIALKADENRDPVRGSNRNVPRAPNSSNWRCVSRLTTRKVPESNRLRFFKID